MPLYLYKCPHCLHCVELWREVDERDHLQYCNECEGLTAIRQVTVPVVRGDTVVKRQG